MSLLKQEEELSDKQQHILGLCQKHPIEAEIFIISSFVFVSMFILFPIYYYVVYKIYLHMKERRGILRFAQQRVTQVPRDQEMRVAANHQLQIMENELFVDVPLDEQGYMAPNVHYETVSD